MCVELITITKLRTQFMEYMKCMVLPECSFSKSGKGWVGGGGKGEVWKDKSKRIANKRRETIKKNWKSDCEVGS